MKFAVFLPFFSCAMRVFNLSMIAFSLGFICVTDGQVALCICLLHLLSVCVCFLEYTSPVLSVKFVPWLLCLCAEAFCGVFLCFFYSNASIIEALGPLTAEVMDLKAKCRIR